MEAPWYDHQKVREMVQLAVFRAMPLFEDYNDINRASLTADIMGELVAAKYDPAKSKPWTFAYRVAFCRLRDISRRRAKEREKQHEAIEENGPPTDSTMPEMTPEEIAANLYEAARNIFAQASVPIRRPGPGRPGLNRAQQFALHALTERMGWSCREAEREITGRPGVLAAVGVSKSPSFRFFSRVRPRVSKFKDFFQHPRRRTG